MPEATDERERVLAQLEALRRKAEAGQANLKAFLAQSKRRSSDKTGQTTSSDANARPAQVSVSRTSARKPAANKRRQTTGDLLNEHDVAARLSKSVQTIRRWRMLKKGPKFFKVVGNVRYKPEDVAAWLNEQPSGGEQPKKGK